MVLSPPRGASGFVAVPRDLFASGDRRSATFRRLIAELATRIELTVATHASAIPIVRSWRVPAAMSIVAIPDAADFSCWAQDSCLIAEDPSGEPLLLLPNAPPLPADSEIVRAVAAHAGLQTRQAPFGFEGGNILVGPDFALVGADTDQRFVEAVTEKGRSSSRRIVSLDMSLPAPSIRWVHSATGAIVEEVYGHAGRRQPLFHLDGFIALAGTAPDGQHRLLVGDSRLAARIADDPRLPLGPQSLADELDAIAGELGSHPEFVVVRNPLPIAAVDDTGLFQWSRSTLQRRYADFPGCNDVLAHLDAHGRKTVPVRRWRALTQNGAITLSAPGRRPTVLLPTYSARYPCLRAVEEYNAQIWTDLGFVVVEIGDFTDFAADNGSPHCLFKPLS
jgi:hypothetical protein